MWKFFDRRYSHLTTRVWVACFPAVIAGFLLSFSPFAVLILVFGLVLARKWLFFYSILFLLALLRTFLAPGPPELLTAGRYAMLGEIVGSPTVGRRAQNFLLSADGRKILVYAEADRILLAGDWVKVHGDLRRISTDGFMQYWARRGVNQSLSAMYTGGVEVIQGGTGLDAIGMNWRITTISRLRRHTNANTASIAMGVVAGQQGLVDKELYHAMQRTGTLHLLSTSGMNVLLVAGVAVWILRQFRIPMVAIAIVMLAILAIYAAAAGSRPPVVRASCIVAIFSLFVLLKQKPDAISILFAVATGLLFVDPSQLYDAGFQLSFVCVFALLLFAMPAFRLVAKFSNSLKAHRYVKLLVRGAGSALAVTVVASFGSIPLVATHFGMTSLISPIANLLTGIAVPFIYAGVMLSWLASFVSDSLSRGFDLMLTQYPCMWVDWVNRTLAKPSFAAIEYQPIPGWISAGILIGILLVSKPPSRTKQELLESDTM